MDNCDAIMLSGETTIGKYPIEIVDTLTKVILSSECRGCFLWRVFGTRFGMSPSRMNYLWYDVV